MIHLPNGYSDEDWSDLSPKERAEALSMAARYRYLSDKKREQLMQRLTEIDEEMGLEADYDAIRDLEQARRDIVAMLEAREDEP